MQILHSVIPQISSHAMDKNKLVIYIRECLKFKYMSFLNNIKIIFMNNKYKLNADVREIIIQLLIVFLQTVVKY